MPQDRRAVVHFLLILLVVPVQYLIVTYFSSTSAQRNYQFQQLLSLAAKYKDTYVSWETWHRWCGEVLKCFASLRASIASLHSTRNRQTASGTDVDNGESVAVEVIKYRNPKGYFGMSFEPRSPRPKDVKFRIGQVIRHKQYNYRGVIVGWDPVGKAPENWLGKSSGNIKERWKNQPNYSILIDVRDRSQPQMAYVAEELIEVIMGVKVKHPDLEKYFEGFNGVQHLPRPQLRVLYPHD